MSKRDNTGDEVHVDDLTWREQDILTLLADRMTNREIADRLHLAESTVKDYVGKILSKLYVKNRREAVERAKALGLLEGEKKTTVRPKTNLPAETTPFIGRVDELEEIRTQLHETRLLTLTGPGGIGKSRLGLKTAEEAVGDFEDGSFFVPLAPIRAVEHIIQTIAEAVRFPLATQEDPQRQLLRYLKDRQLLLVMDNFEHLLDGAEIVSEILQASPRVKVLATSRERLNLQTETVLNVSGMAFPDPVGSKGALNYDAVSLFKQSASKVRPGFNPSPDELGQIANVCQIVGGMPLAIELAAAWLQILSVDEITEELEKGFDILATEVRDAPERHRSIRAVFDHSWSLLNKTEQEIFTLLTVFRGGFTREAVQQVAGASLQLIMGLVNKSFLSHDPDSSRLEIHELLRQYAQEQLEETPKVNVSTQEAHAAYYAAFMEEKGLQLRGHKQMQALAEIQADIENVRVAWRFCLEQKNTSQIWMFIYGLWHVYWIRWWNHAGMALFEEAVRALEGEDDVESRALRGLAMAFQSYFMAWLDLFEQGYELAKDSVEILKQFDHPEGLAFAYDSLLVNGYMVSQFQKAISGADEMVKIANEVGDKWLLAFTLFAASMAALYKKDYTEARRMAETNLNLNEEVGDLIGSTMPLIVLGHAALGQGEYEEARGHYLRSLKISERVGFHYSIQTSTKYLGKVTLLLGEIAEAEKYLVQSLRITKEIGFLRDLIRLIYEFACLRAAQDNLEQAVELLALALQHPASDQTRWLEGSTRDSVKELLAELEGKLSQEDYKAAVERGKELDLEEVVNGLVGARR